MLGIFSFITTTFLLSQAANLLLLPVAVYRFFSSKNPILFSGAQKLGWALIFLSATASVAAFTFASPTIENYEKSVAGGIPYILLIAVALLIGATFKLSDLKWILYAIVIEIFIGVAEYMAGVPSFFGVQAKGDTMIGDTDLLYFNRVFGLSLNSSVYGFKVILGLLILLVLRHEFSKKSYIFLLGVFFAGFVTSFNRTAIVAGLIALAIHYRRERKLLMIVLPVLIGIGVYGFSFLMENLSRGREGFDWSGRDVIFSRFFSFFYEHPIIGNAAQKVWMYLDGKLYHAHNSYLELLASNGLIIALVFLGGYFFLLVAGAYAVAIPMLVYSMFQYGLFWGLVFHDIVFAALMFYVLRQRLIRRHRAQKVESAVDKSGNGSLAISPTYKI